MQHLDRTASGTDRGKALRSTPNRSACGSGMCGIFRAVFGLLCFVFSLCATGCVATSLLVSNATPSDIRVVSGHTGDSVRIPSGKSKTIAHSIGPVSVLDSTDDVVVSGHVDVMKLNREGHGGFGSVVRVFSTIRAFVVFKADGIYAAQKRRRRVPSPDQPEGFPILSARRATVQPSSPSSPPDTP